MLFRSRTTAAKKLFGDAFVAADEVALPRIGVAQLVHELRCGVATLPLPTGDGLANFRLGIVAISATDKQEADRKPY